MEKKKGTGNTMAGSKLRRHRLLASRRRAATIEERAEERKGRSTGSRRKPRQSGTERRARRPVLKPLAAARRASDAALSWVCTDREERWPNLDRPGRPVDEPQGHKKIMQMEKATTGVAQFRPPRPPLHPSRILKGRRSIQVQHRQPPRAR